MKGQKRKMKETRVNKERAEDRRRQEEKLEREFRFYAFASCLNQENLHPAPKFVIIPAQPTLFSFFLGLFLGVPEVQRKIYLSAYAHAVAHCA